MIKNLDRRWNESWLILTLHYHYKNTRKMCYTNWKSRGSHPLLPNGGARTHPHSFGCARGRGCEKPTQNLGMRPIKNH